MNVLSLNDKNVCPIVRNAKDWSCMLFRGFVVNTVTFPSVSLHAAVGFLPLLPADIFLGCVHISPFLHTSNSRLIVLNQNTLFLALFPIAPLCQRDRGVDRFCDPPDEVIMWKQTVLNPPLTPVTPLCYTTPDNERYTERQRSTGQHFLWLWLHWSWFTVILRYETQYKMSNPAAAAQTHWELFGRTQSSEGNLLWSRNYAMCC